MVKRKIFLRKERKESIVFYPGRANGTQDPRPAVLVIPGGGYGGVCESTEGSPVAKKFNRLGFHAFVLDYRVAPHRFPEPQQDALRAIRLIRANASEFGVNPAKIAVCGFSAGGHLAASTGIFYKTLDSSAGDGADAFSARPDALILGYPVISFEPWSHPGTMLNLLGENPAPEQIRALSLEKQIGADMPPTFVWHTVTDQWVSFRNSLVFAEAMAKEGRPCSLHLFPRGDHGMLLGLGTDAEVWPELAADFLNTQWNPLPAERFTNAWQAEMEKKTGHSVSGARRCSRG